MADFFHFKQFSVLHQTSFNVGTDAILLGALAPVTISMRQALDIGTGCGVIALMLLQRKIPYVTAIEKDPLSAIEAQINAEKSPWHTAMNVLCSDFCDEQWGKPLKRFDLIVSNPPFFTRSLRSSNARRNVMRHNNDTLPFDILIKHATAQLATTGCFSVILPLSECYNFINLAYNNQLYIQSIVHIYSKPNKPELRQILTFSTSLVEKIPEMTFCIRKMDDSYSDIYRQLTADFYLT